MGGDKAPFVLIRLDYFYKIPIYIMDDAKGTLRARAGLPVSQPISQWNKLIGIDYKKETDTAHKPQLLQSKVQ
jgi:hypothetical protein